MTEFLVQWVRSLHIECHFLLSYKLEYPIALTMARMGSQSNRKEGLVTDLP